VTTESAAAAAQDDQDDDDPETGIVPKTIKAHIQTPFCRCATGV
jgi:hypothetical protein